MSVNDDRKTAPDRGDGESRGFFGTLLASLLRHTATFIIAFAVGTGAGAIACWYYGIPLVFSLLAGLIVLGIALALLSDSLFS